MTTTVDAPLALYTDVVRPEWIDYNQHMSEGYYAVAFGEATDAFMNYAGIDAPYREASGCTIYTAESHICYLRELKLGTALRFTTMVLGYDAKRIQLFHQMYHADEGFLAATSETMLLHVNSEPRTAPMPDSILAKVAAAYEAHRALALPPQVGRSVKHLAKS